MMARSIEEPNPSGLGKNDWKICVDSLVQRRPSRFGCVGDVSESCRAAVSAGAHRFNRGLVPFFGSRCEARRRAGGSVPSAGASGRAGPRGRQPISGRTE
jgi:hypothetical protein